MTGNDIVDLRLALEPGGERRRRFLQKIFTAREQEIIKSGEAGMWTIWAVKEAIYKAHHRRFNLARKFDPRGIETFFLEQVGENMEAKGEYAGQKYWGKGNVTSEYIHFSASCLPQEMIFQEIHPASVNIEKRLKFLISEKLHLQADEISLNKNANLIPELFYKNSQLNVPFSISHHGRFKAFSFQLINY